MKKFTDNFLRSRRDGEWITDMLSTMDQLRKIYALLDSSL